MSERVFDPLVSQSTNIHRAAIALQSWAIGSNTKDSVHFILHFPIPFLNKTLLLSRYLFFFTVAHVTWDLIPSPCYNKHWILYIIIWAKQMRVFWRPLGKFFSRRASLTLPWNMRNNVNPTCNWHEKYDASDLITCHLSDQGTTESKRERYSDYPGRVKGANWVFPRKPGCLVTLLWCRKPGLGGRRCSRQPIDGRERDEVTAMFMNYLNFLLWIVNCFTGWASLSQEVCVAWSWEHFRSYIKKNFYLFNCLF